MRIDVDQNRFDELQIRLLEELVASVKHQLEQVGIADQRKVHEATSHIVFDVCTIIDGSRVMALVEKPVVPVLTFAKGYEQNG
jgi:hypothetical protein